MYRRSISLIALSFAAAVGVEARAQDARSDAPVATAPAEVALDAMAAPIAPAAAPAPMVLSRQDMQAALPLPTGGPAESVTSAEEVEFRRASDKIIDLAPGVSVGSRKVDAGEAGGGFLRTNPELQRSNRKQVGFSFKF